MPFQIHETFGVNYLPCMYLVWTNETLKESSDNHWRPLTTHSKCSTDILPVTLDVLSEVPVDKMFLGQRPYFDGHLFMKQCCSVIYQYDLCTEA